MNEETNGPGPQQPDQPLDQRWLDWCYCEEPTGNLVPPDVPLGVRGLPAKTQVAAIPDGYAERHAAEALADVEADLEDALRHHPVTPLLLARLEDPDRKVMNAARKEAGPIIHHLVKERARARAEALKYESRHYHEFRPTGDGGTLDPTPASVLTALRVLVPLMRKEGVTGTFTFRMGPMAYIPFRALLHHSTSILQAELLEGGEEITGGMADMVYGHFEPDEIRPAYDRANLGAKRALDDEAHRVYCAPSGLSAKEAETYSALRRDRTPPELAADLARRLNQ